MKSQAFNITLPAELVQKVDELAKREFANRSDYIRSALVRQIREDEGWDAFFASANTKGRKLGITSEEQVNQAITDYRQSQS